MLDLVYEWLSFYSQLHSVNMPAPEISDKQFIVIVATERNGGVGQLEGSATC